MSPTPADLVNAIELAGRAATLERSLTLRQLPRLIEAGALEGTHADAELAFDTFEGRASVRVRVEGEVMLTCQRCLRPCAWNVAEDASLVVVTQDVEEVPGGFEPLLGDPERLSLTELIEEQLLLGLPLVPRHANAASCGEASTASHGEADEPAAEDRQRPFANLRALLDESDG